MDMNEARNRIRYLQEFLKDISIEDSVKYLRSKLMVEDNLTLDEQIDMYYYLVNTLISKKYKPFDDHVLLGYYVKDFNSYRMAVVQEAK